MTQTRALWGEGATTAIKKWMNDAYKQYASKYSLVAQVESSEGEFEKYMNNAGLGSISEVAEGSQIPSVDPTKGYLTMITNKKYSGKIVVTREEVKDNRYKIWNKRATMLSKALSRKMDAKFFSLFRNGFDTGFTPYGDMKPLFSTKHPTQQVGGSTQSNASSTGITLTEANLNTGLEALYNQLDDSGELIDLTDEKVVLMVPLALQKDAFTLLESELRSGTANNDTNYYKHGVNFDLFVNPWIGSKAKATETNGNAGSDTAWFLIAPGVSELIMQKRESLFIDQWEDKDIQSMIVSGTTRFGVGAGNWRGVWGSKGDGAAYSD